MKTIDLFDKELKFANEELLKVVALAQKAGYKVHTFRPSGSVISQIFIDNGRTFGSSSASFGGVTYSTCHKSERGSGNGSGFVMSENCESANIKGIESCFCFAPNWATRTNTIKKQTWEQYLSEEKILTYAELPEITL